MLADLIHFLVHEIGMSGPIGIHPDNLLDLTKSYYTQQTKPAPSSEKLPQKLDEAFLSYLWDVLIEQDDIRVGREELLSSSTADASKKPGKGKRRATDTEEAEGRVAMEEDDREEEDHREAIARLPQKKRRTRADKSDTPLAVRATLVDLNEEELFSSDLWELKEDHGSKLRIALSEDKAYFILTGTHRGKLALGDQMYQALTLVAQSKTQGITTISLTDVMGLDPKTIHYFTKSLLGWGLIAKFQAYAHGTHTAIHFHSRYTTQSAEYLTLRGTASATAASSSISVLAPTIVDGREVGNDELGELPQTMFSYLDVVQHRILHVLARNPQGIARRETLLRDIGYKGVVGRQQQRMLARCIRHIVARGEIRRVYLRNSNPEGKFASLERGFQLIQKVEGSVGSEDVMSDHGDEEEDDEIGETISEEDENALAAALVDGSDESLGGSESSKEEVGSLKRFEPNNKMEPSTSIEYQIMKMLQEAGATGVTCQAVTHELKVDRKFVDHFLERFAKQPLPPHLSHRGLVSLADVLGKEKLIYAFDTEGYLQQCREHGFTPDAQAFPPPDEERARGFLDLGPYEFFKSKEQHVAWNDSFDQGHLGPMILRMPVLAFFNSCIFPDLINPDEEEEDDHKPLTRGRRRIAPIPVGSASVGSLLARSKGGGHQYKRGLGKSTYAQLRRIAAGEEALPASSSERRRITGRAATEGIDISEAIATWNLTYKTKASPRIIQSRSSITLEDFIPTSSLESNLKTTSTLAGATSIVVGPTPTSTTRRGRPPTASMKASPDLVDGSTSSQPSSSAPFIKRGLGGLSPSAIQVLESPTVVVVPRKRGRPSKKTKPTDQHTLEPSTNTLQSSIEDLLIVKEPSPTTTLKDNLAEGLAFTRPPRKRARFSEVGDLAVEHKDSPNPTAGPSSGPLYNTEHPPFISPAKERERSHPIRKSPRISFLPITSKHTQAFSVADLAAPSTLPPKPSIVPSFSAFNNSSVPTTQMPTLESESVETPTAPALLRRRSNAPRASLHGPSHAQTKRDKFFVDWIESLGGVHDISSTSPLQLQRYLETAIADASAKGVHLRLNATTMIDKKTWSASLDRLISKSVLQTRTVATEVNGSMLTIKFVFLSNTLEDTIQEEIRRLASLADLRGKQTLASKVADQRMAAQKSRPKGVIEADMGPQPLTERERLFRAAMETMAKEAEEKRAFFAGKAAQKRIQLGEDWLALARKHLAKISIPMTPTLELNIQAVQQQELAKRSGGRLDGTYIASLVQELLEIPEADRPLPRETPTGKQKKGSRPRRPKVSDVNNRVDDALQLQTCEESLEVPFFLPVTREDDDLIPVSLRGPPEETVLDPSGPRRRTRFTDELDDMIMDLGAILETRGREHGFMFTWKPATKVITSLNHNILRHRYSVLRERLGKKAYINGLSEAYSRLWKVHRGSSNLPEPAGARSTEFDIVHHVKFFRKNVQKNHLLDSIVEGQLAATPSTISIVPALPSKISNMKNWDIVSPDRDHNPWSWLLELSATVTAEFAEKKTLEAPFMIEPIVPEKKTEPVDPRLSREHGIVGSVIKMLVNPATRSVDPAIAEKILPHTLQVDTVHSSLMKSGVISKIGKSKAPPTRSFEISEGFVKQSEGPYEHIFFKDAADVHNAEKEDTMLLEDEHSIWPLVAPEGATAKLIDLVSDDRVEFIVDREEMENLAGRGMIDTKKLDDEDLEFHTYIRITQPAPLPNLDTEHYLAAPFSDFEPEHIELIERKQTLIALKKAGAGEWVDLFEKGLELAGKDGLTWDALITLISWPPVLDVLHFARVFCDTTPSLAFWAGYDQARLISSAFYPDWSVDIPDADELVYPRKWVNLQGEVQQEEWEKNVRCVIGTLMHRPHVAEWLLREVLDPVLDRPELNDILRHLFKNGWARRSTFTELHNTNEIVDAKPIGWLSLEEEKLVGWCLVGEKWMSESSGQYSAGDRRPKNRH